jgi:GT2 family glycosyltransferase
MKISIIIPIYNKKEYTQKCLESIFRHGSKYEFEIIVVDNGSTDGSGEYLSELEKEKGDKVTVVKNEKNLGFAKACNQGAKKTLGEYLLFLNNDTVVTDKWLDILAGELDANDNIGIVGPKLLYPDSTVQQAGIVFDDEKWPHHIYKKERGDALYVNKKREFQCLTGACFLIRRDIFEKVGGFDEVYINGLEDLDLCLKVRGLGSGILYCPESVVYHHESVTPGRSNYDERNVKIFYSRWREKIKVDYQDFLKEDGMTNMGEFLDTFHGDKMSFKKLYYLIQRFMITAKRDGLVRAITKTWNRFIIKK